MASARTRLWQFDLATGAERQLADLAGGRLATTADGRFAAVYDWHRSSLSGWSVGGDPPRQLWAIEGAVTFYTVRPSVSPDGSTILLPLRRTLNDGGYPAVAWDASTGERRGEQLIPVYSGTPLDIHPDGETLAYGSENRLVIGSLRPSGPSPSVFDIDGRKRLNAVAFHPSGRWLAAASNDATVRLYDTGSWAVAKTFAWDAGRVRCLAFSPDGTLAAAGTHTGRVVVWDVDG